MNSLAFILGLVLGLAICYWQRYRLKSQLKPMLTSLSDTADLMGLLPIASLVRREILHLRQQGQQREEELETWQMLVDRAPIGFLQVDADNQLLWCNQQGLALLNIDRWQPGQVRLLLELVRSYELDRLIEQTRQQQQPQVGEWIFYPTHYLVEGNHQNQQGRELSSASSLALKASSYPLPQGKVGVFIENQQPLLELCQSRNRAFSDLSHELRTPLTSISLVAEALQKRLPDPERRWAGQMLKETNRLIELVQQWLELGQLQEDPSQNLCYQSLELGELILAAWQSLEPLARQKGVTLTRAGDEQIFLQGDRSRLTQVFLNLLDNAIKYSPVGGEIGIEVTTLPPTSELESVEEPSIIVDIVDQGCGFFEANLPYVFDRLYRGDPSRTRQSSEPQSSPIGSGLGLSIAREIIQAHGGSLKARNHPETGGAWLQILLPVNSTLD